MIRKAWQAPQTLAPGLKIEKGTFTCTAVPLLFVPKRRVKYILYVNLSPKKYFWKAQERKK